MIQTLFSHSMATKTPQKSLNSDTIPDFSRLLITFLIN